MKIKLIKKFNEKILKNGKNVSEKIKKIRFGFLMTVLGMGIFSIQPLQAFMGFDYYMDPTNFTSDWLREDTLRRTYENHNEVFKSQKSRSTGKSSKSSKNSGTSKTTVSQSKTKAKVTFKSDGSTRGLEAIIKVYPANQRTEVRKVYQQLYNAYPKVAKSLGIPTNDMASGFATLLVGSYMAYHNTTFNDAHVKPLANQLRSTMQEIDDFNRMSDSDKKMVYDQMVMLGMMMAVSQAELQKQPNARVEAQLREVGKQILEGILKVKANRVKLTSEGLSIK